MPPPETTARGGRYPRAAVILATTLAGAVATIGMLASFHTVSAEMRPSFQGWAWAVPVTIDFTVAAFSLLELALLQAMLPHLPARLAVYGATAATIYLNTRSAAEEGERAQMVAHAAMPAVWALYIDLLRCAAVTLTRRERAAAEHPVLVFLLAPKAAATAWRDSILASAGLPRPTGTLAEKMSPTDGHYPPPELDQDTVRRGADIFCTDRPDEAGPSPIPHHAASPTTSAPHPRETTVRPDNRRAPQIGKGRGLTSRHAVLDLARRHPELTNTQIATRLKVSARTVRRHRNPR